MSLFATRKPGAKVINLSPDIARALMGAAAWVVELHALPGWRFRCDAPNLDGAHAMALAYLVKARGAQRLTGATIVAA